MTTRRSPRMAPAIDVSLRPSTSADREALWQIRTRAMRETCNSHYDVEMLGRWSAVPMPPEFCTTSGPREFIVAEAEGVAVGFALLDRETGEIAAVFVRPDLNRRGIGSRLLHELEIRARNSGLDRVYLSATLNAVDFYRALGFRDLEPGKFRHSLGFEMDCMLMEKLLDHAETVR